MISAKPLRPLLFAALTLLLTLLTSSCTTLQPLPKSAPTDARIAQFAAIPAPPLQQPATVYWNDYMVPFVEAGTDTDAALMLGMIHAHLRLGSMEIGKRVALGRISEMFGPLTTDIDAALRALGVNRAAAAVIAQMPAASRAWLEAYVAGVNHYKSHLKALPHEMRVLNMDDEPWRLEDSIALGRLGGVDVNWLAIVSLLPQRAKAQWPQIWQRIARTQAETITSFQVPAQTAAASARPRQLQLLAQMLAPYIRAGSNSFAVAGHRSAAGAPIIANDPHLGFAIPNLWLIAGLKSPGYHVVGMMPAGLPIFAFGRNTELAWGGTNMRQEASDFVELDERENTTSETHTIKRRLWWDAESSNRLSAYGPVISDAEVLAFPAGKQVALRWIGHQPSDEISAMLGVAKAGGWRDMYKAIEGFSIPGQNFIFADTAGNVGHLLAAWIPKRQPVFPSDLWVTPEQSDRAWQDIYKPDRLPYLVNPQTGVIASANNKPVAAADLRLGWLFSPDDRVKQIYNRLAARERWSRADIKQLQQDVYSASHIAVRDTLIDVSDKLDLSPRARRALAAIARWDGHFHAQSATAYLYHVWLSSFTPLLYEGDMFELWSRNSHLPHLVNEDLRQRPAAELQPLLEASLQQTAAHLEDGRVWGDIHRLKVQHFLGNIPLLGRRYRWYDIPVPGYSETIMKTAGDLTAEKHAAFYGAQSRHVSDLSDINANYFILFGGQDGWINSANSIDQVPLWQRGEYIRVPMELEEVRRTFRQITSFTVQAKPSVAVR